MHLFLIFLLKKKKTKKKQANDFKWHCNTKIISYQRKLKERKNYYYINTKRICN